MQPYLQNVVFIHSLFRYFILLFAIVVAAQSLIGMVGKKEFQKANRIMALFLLIFCDLQLVLGIALYYYKLIASGLMQSVNVMKDPFTRFYAVEHSVSMVLAIVLVHIAYSDAKKSMNADRKFKRMFWCSFIALAIFLAMIPWEGKPVVGRPNFPSMQAS
jgi:heme A synthase